jgi:subtilisin family serine protease
VSIFVIRPRPGLGAAVDPHLDAALGRSAASGARAAPESALASGYVELVGASPWQDLIALLEAVYGEPPRAAGLPARIGSSIGLYGRPLAWTHIGALRYLTTDEDTGIALPMHRFDPGHPSATDARGAAEQLERLTAGRLRAARMIGLTVSFRIESIAAGLHALLYPAALRRWLRPGAARARADLRQRLNGGAPPWLGPLAAWLEGGGKDRFAAQALGAAGMFRPQWQRAMHELRTGQTEPPVAAGYGMAETGRGTLVGIVDFGCDFAHPRFRRAGVATQSRVLALWDQNSQPERPPSKPPLARPDPVVIEVAGQACEFGYGRLFTRRHIEDALAAWQAGAASDLTEPYRLLGYDPHDHHFTSHRPGTPGGPLVAHGFQVMQVALAGAVAGCSDVAAATPGLRGVASEADIVFVQIRQHRAADGRRMLDLNDVVDAIAFVFHVAEREQRPCVVNLSLNTMSGPHDGDGYFERRLAALLRSASAGPAARGRAVVIAAGNLPALADQSRRWQHLRQGIPPGGRLEFEWLVAADDRTRNSVEIWYDAVDTWLQVTVVPPDGGPPLGPVAAGSAAEILVDGQPRGSVIGSRPVPQLLDRSAWSAAASAASDTLPGRHVILLEVEPFSTGSPNGATWKVVVESVDRTGHPATTGSTVVADAWLERDDEGQSGIRRIDPAAPILDQDREVTIGTLSCGDDAIVVGAYSTRASAVDGWAFSGRGPSRRGDPKKPDLSAPGDRVLLEIAQRDGATGAGCFAAASGTSIAAPFVTGTIACLYEAWPDAPLATVREALRAASRPAPGAAAASWSDTFGHGRLDPAHAVATLKAARPPHNAATPVTTPEP